MRFHENFYAEVTSEKGEPLTRSALTGTRAAIHRQLTSAPISMSIIILQDSEFLSANKMFETAAQTLNSSWRQSKASPVLFSRSCLS